MKLLFDENLAPSLVAALTDIYPQSVHVRDLGPVARVPARNAGYKAVTWAVMLANA